MKHHRFTLSLSNIYKKNQKCARCGYSKHIFFKFFYTELDNLNRTESLLANTFRSCYNQCKLNIFSKHWSIT